jgi:hypothetical protein
MTSIRVAGCLLGAVLVVSPTLAVTMRSRDAVRMENFHHDDNVSGAGQPVVLFDASHAQTAGNADWTIDGGYSSFADTLRHHGYVVRALQRGDFNRQTLQNVAVVVCPEPNTRYGQKELDELSAFVMSGGGLFAIGDHGGSDRNNDGWDSPKIIPGAQTELTQDVRSIGAWGASSLVLKDRSATVHFYLKTKEGRFPYVASNPFGRGRVVAIGDSSPLDDGTGHPGHHLYNGYDNPKYTIPQFALNTINWLAKRPHELVDGNGGPGAGH